MQRGGGGGGGGGRANPDAERNNPCLKEQEMSYACLNKNDFDHDKCESYFENYKACKKFWGKISRERRFRGIRPCMPDVEERPRIKEQYMKSTQQAQT